MPKRLLLSALLLTQCTFSFAQIHAHGHGQAFVAQEGNTWKISIVLPAADVLGFEHAPETEEQKKIVKDFRHLVSAGNEVLILNKSCHRTVLEIKVPEESEHDHGEEHHDSHKHHSEELHAEATHENVEINFEFNCKSTVETVSFPLILELKSLETVNVQWFTDSGQGASKVTKSSIKLSL